MINYAIYNQINQQLLEISSLTKSLYLSSGSFYKVCLDYLNKFQKFADQHHLAISHDIAINIEKLIVFEGSKDKVNRANLRKQKDAYAVSCLEEICNKIRSFIEKDAKNFEECQDIWRQVLARAQHKGINFKKMPQDLILDSIISAVIKDAELLPYYSHILGLLGIHNTKAILDIVLPQLQI